MGVVDRATQYQIGRVQQNFNYPNVGSAKERYSQFEVKEADRLQNPRSPRVQV